MRICVCVSMCDVYVCVYNFYIANIYIYIKKTIL